MAKISVIVAIYGVEKFLKEAVDSILNQTLTDLEIILVDDGSKDNCPQIIDEYAKKDNRIIAIHKANGGYGQSMNIGLEKATGEYIAILEPDDYIAPKMYEDLYSIAKKFDSDIVKSCFYDNFQTKELTRIQKREFKDYIPEDKSFTIKEYPYFLYHHPSIWSCIYKREFLNKNNIRFVEALGSGWTDNPFQVQTMCLAKRINYTSTPYYYWRKLNFFEADALNDYTIPFNRIEEIHSWLRENNIDDKNILLQLFRRELDYVMLVLRMKKIADKEDCYKRIQELLKNCPDDFCQNKEVTKREREFYNSAKNNLNFTRFKSRLRVIRRGLLTVRLNRTEKHIILLGKQILAK